MHDLFDAEGMVFLVTSRRHFAEVESILGERARAWQETPRRRLYGNRPRVAVGQERNGSR